MLSLAVGALLSVQQACLLFLWCCARQGSPSAATLSVRPAIHHTLHDNGDVEHESAPAAQKVPVEVVSQKPARIRQSWTYGRLSLTNAIASSGGPLIGGDVRMLPT
jgi:hypothetical protein